MALKSDWVDGDVMAGNHATEHNELTTAVVLLAWLLLRRRLDADAAAAAVGCQRQVPFRLAGQSGKCLRECGLVWLGDEGWAEG